MKLLFVAQGAFVAFAALMFAAPVAAQAPKGPEPHASWPNAADASAAGQAPRGANHVAILTLERPSGRSGRAQALGARTAAQGGKAAPVKPYFAPPKEP
jgi:hypothetical protein